MHTCSMQRANFSLLLSCIYSMCYGFFHEEKPAEIQRQKVGWWVPGAGGQGLGEEFNGGRVQFCKMERALEMPGVKVA